MHINRLLYCGNGRNSAGFFLLVFFGNNSTYYSYSENNFINLKRIQKHPFSRECRGSDGCQENFKSMGSGAMMKPDSLDTDVYSLCKKELPLQPHLCRFTGMFALGNEAHRPPVAVLLLALLSFCLWYSAFYPLEFMSLIIFGIDIFH